MQTFSGLSVTRKKQCLVNIKQFLNYAFERENLNLICTYHV